MFVLKNSLSLLPFSPSSLSKILSLSLSNTHRVNHFNTDGSSKGKAQTSLSPAYFSSSLCFLYVFIFYQYFFIHFLSLQLFIIYLYNNNMYNWVKTVREERLGKISKIPSFSSSLLDQIYSSIDGVEKRREEAKSRKRRNPRKQSNGDYSLKQRISTIKEEAVEEMAASLRRDFRLRKWAGKKMTMSEKVCTRKLPSCSHTKSEVDHDSLFFSSSSESSSGGFSSSETETFGPPKPNVVPPPKPIRTRAFSSSSQKPNSASGRHHRDVLLFDDHNNGGERNTDGFGAHKSHQDLSTAISKVNPSRNGINLDLEGDKDDASDSSSDLFELDHWRMIGATNRYREELPVYETTHLDTNRAIAYGIVR